MTFNTIQMWHIIEAVLILLVSIRHEHVSSFRLQVTGSPWVLRVLKGNVFLGKSAVEIEHLKSNIVFYNSLSKKKEHFQPLNPPVVTFYSCGPTIYDYAHIGNFRAFLIYDLIKRWLQYVGYSVQHICNLTDVDDKIILKMAREGKSLQEITSFYTNTFFQDLKTLNIIPATKYPKATEFIPQMVSMIDNLLEKNIAYSVNGSVYYSVEAFQPKYGVLTDHLNDNTLQSSVGRGSLDKRNSRDFALWKAHTPADGNVAWEASFGKGRPGWHIECSAMCCSLLGESIDIHSGGMDLMFPHHTNEILQSEAVTGKQYSRFWMHNGFVSVNSEKMSKSLQNFQILRDIVHTSLDARAFRFLMLSVQYRNPIHFSREALRNAKASLQRLDKLLERLRSSSGQMDIESDATIPIQDCVSEFENALCDDLNTPRALAAVFRLISLGEDYLQNTERITFEISNNFLQAFDKLNAVLGVCYDVPGYSIPEQSKDPHFIDNARLLAEKRHLLKQSREFAEADKLRMEILDLGFHVRDLKDGYELVPASDE